MNSSDPSTDLCSTPEGNEAAANDDVLARTRNDLSVRFELITRSGADSEL